MSLLYCVSSVFCFFICFILLLRGPVFLIEEEHEQELSQYENVEAISSEELTPMISCNALVEISTPQTLKIEGYIKNKKLIVLIDSGSTHNFIHYKLAKALNCFVYPAPEFQVMIADGGTINCLGKCNKINLTMGEYIMIVQ
jgi:hypothetical protein